MRETPLSHSFCRHVVDSGAPLEVVDARTHPKVRDNPAIEDFGIVSYLGMPLTTSDGERLGALCAIDHEPRQWTGRDHGVLEDLAGAAMAEVELRRANRAVAAAAAELHFAATHDTLTRLGNRRALLDDLGQLLADGRPATFALLDLHGMRGFNDAHGHIAGDELLARLGERLESRARRPRARVPARRRAAVRAADGDRRRGGRVGRPRLRRARAPTQLRGRLPRGDGRAAARGDEHRGRAAPRRRAAGTLRACCDRWRLTSRNAGPRARLGGGEEKIARQHDAGKLTARERIALLIDDGTFTELGVHARPHFSQRAMDGREAPADGVITGFGKVDGRCVARRRLRLHGHGRLDGHDRRDQGRAACASWR